MFSSFAASEDWLHVSETEVGGVELVELRAEELSSEEAEAEQGRSDEASKGSSESTTGTADALSVVGKDITNSLCQTACSAVPRLRDRRRDYVLSSSAWE